MPLQIGSDAQKKTKQRSAIAVLEETVKQVSTLDKSQAEMKSLVDAALAEVKELRDALGQLDVKAVMNAIEKVKSQVSTVQRNIQRSAAIKVPGAEDLAGSFNMIKAIAAIKSGGKIHGDSAEWELAKQYKAKAAQVIGVESDGGWFISDEVIPNVIDAIYRKSVLVDLAGDGETRATVINGLTGANVSIPRFNGGALAYWGNELTKAQLTKVKVGNINMKPKKISCIIRLTEEMIRFGSFGFEEFLRVSMVRAIAKEVDRAFLFGTGANDEPEGLASLGIKTYAAGGDAAVAAELDWTGLSEGMDILIEEADLEEDETFATISSPRWFKRISNLRVLNFDGQTSGQPYLAGLPPITQQRLADLLGDFGKTTAISSSKDVGTGGAVATDVFRGNFGEMIVGRWGGIEVVTEDGYDIADDSRLVKLRSYMDANIRYPGAIVRCPNAKARN